MGSLSIANKTKKNNLDFSKSESDIKGNTISSFLLGFSGLLIYFAWDECFNMQCLILVFGLMLISLLFEKIRFKKQYNTNLLLVFCLSGIYFISLFVSYFLSPQTITFNSFIRIGYSIYILCFFLVVVWTKFSFKNIRMILFGNAFSGLVISLLVIFNWINGAIGKISLISFFGKSIEENYTASTICMSSLILLYFGFYHKNVFVRITSFLLTGVVFFAICLTGCRAAILSFVLGAFSIYLIFLIFKKNALISKIIISVVLVVAIVAFLTFMDDILPSNLSSRIISMFNGGLNDTSNDNRIKLWTNGLQGLIHRPFFGYGVGNFNYFVRQIPEFAHHTVVVAHNTWIDILVDSGLIGFCTFLVLIFKNIKCIFSKKCIVFIPYFICWLICSTIVGGERTYFVWNGIFIMSIINNYCLPLNNFDASDFFGLRSINIYEKINYCNVDL